MAATEFVLDDSQFSALVEALENKLTVRIQRKDLRRIRETVLTAAFVLAEHVIHCVHPNGYGRSNEIKEGTSCAPCLTPSQIKGRVDAQLALFDW